ncbi:MAG: hypothetical protein GX927_04910 [Lentisphaerae bacterium]|jgi:rhamnulokinase|nr:hypothetical protein [Lentisphaerota bacterium]
MKSQSHIAIDLGAGSGRIMIGTRRKNEIQLVEAARFSHLMKSVDGVLCWDYQGLSSNLIDALHVACSKLDAVPQSISCDSWAQDFALLDANGKVCGKIVSYREQRTADMPQHITAMIPPEELQSRIGRKTVGSFSTLAQLKFLAEQEPDLLDRASTLLHIADLIHYELCENAVSNWALASVSQLMNIQTQTWDAEMLEKLRIPTHFLGKIASGSIIGQVNDSRFPAILQGVPVVSGVGHDTAAAFLAVDSAPDAFFLSLGTWAMLGHQHDAGKPFPEGANPLGIVPGLWTAFRGLPGMWLQQQCIQHWEKQRIFPGYAAFDAAVDASGCKGVFDPTSPELFSPADMPAAIQELCDRNHSEIPVTPGDFGKVINRSLAECYAQAAGQTGKLIVTGGGINNAPLMKELSARFAICKGPCEATALGNIKAQIIALS